jgi:carbonic anhydrase
MKFLLYGIIFVMTLGNCGTILAGEADKPIESTNSTKAPMTPQVALQKLMEGNKRFLDDKTTCPDRNQIRRMATAAKQKPFAIVLGCSDSRIPPEIAFDQGIGDIFVVRVAGNIVSAIELDSIEYSAIYNGSSIIMVLGHESCGAVEAVLAKQTKDIESIADFIKPALKKLNQSPPVNLVDAIEANVNNSVARIKESEAIQKLIKAGKIDVVPAYYDFTTGAVRILENKS